MSLKKWLLCNLIFIKAVAFSQQINTSDEPSYLNIQNLENNKTLLERSPDYFWNEDKINFHWGVEGEKNPCTSKGGYQSKGSAGIVPYAIREDRIYILLARETWGIDKNKYCDLGGAVEAYGTRNSMAYVDTFLYTLLKEGEEESGGLYKFSENEFMKTAITVSYKFEIDNFYNGFESVISFYQVNEIYSNEKFIKASKKCAYDQLISGLCPWGYQEKDDYQWIDLNSVVKFLQNSTENSGLFENIDGKLVEITMRDHFIELLRSSNSIDALLLILKSVEDLTPEEEISLNFASIFKINAFLSNKIGSSLPLGITQMAS